MFRSTSLLPLIGAALLLSSCGSKPGSNSNDAITIANDQADAASPGPAPAETKGQEFVAAVLGGYDFAIASARMLGERAEGANVRQFGQQMASDFGASRDALKAAATGLKLEQLAGPADQTDMAVLSSTKSVPFEKAFAAQQLTRLSEMLGLIRAYKNGGDNPALKAWAEKAQATVNDRLLAVQTLKAELEEADEK